MNIMLLLDLNRRGGKNIAANAYNESNGWVLKEDLQDFLKTIYVLQLNFIFSHTKHLKSNQSPVTYVMFFIVY